MRTLITSFLALLLCFMLPIGEAQAKKLGGGFTLGKTYTAPKKPTAPASSTTTTASKQQDTATTPTAAKPRSGFGGLLGGLLAGGLLGALFFGGAFEGIQIMDVLLIALVGFILFKLLSGRRASAPQPAYAGATAGNAAEPQWRHAGAAHETPAPAVPATPAATGFDGVLARAELDLPARFNTQGV